MFCTNCGKKIGDDLSFCVYCGKPVQKAQEKAQHSPASAPQSGSAVPAQPVVASSSVSEAKATAGAAAPASSAPNTTPAYTPNLATAPAAKGASVNPVGNTRRKRGPIIGILIALVIVAALIIAGALTNWFGLGQTPVKGSVNDYSWGELSSISSKISEANDEYEAIEIAKKYNLVGSDGKLDGTQVKDITLSDGSTVQVQIAGILHDDKADGSGKAGLTFIFKDGMTSRAINSSNTNSGGWADSQIRSWLTNEGMNMLPEDLREHIVSVKKLTNNVGQTTDASSVSETSDRLWLFSPVELYGVMSFYTGKDAYCNAILNVEGKEYKLFRDCGTAMGQNNQVLAKTYNGKVSAWWTRSPLPSSPAHFCGVDKDGHNASAGAEHPHNVSPGFSL